MALHHQSSRKIVAAQRADLVAELERVDAKLARLDEQQYMVGTDHTTRETWDELFQERDEIQRDLDLLHAPARHHDQTVRAIAERE